MIEELTNTNDNELIMLYHEEDEDAKNMLFIKYKYIIDIIFNKYRRVFSLLNIDSQDIYSECNLAFSDALRRYNPDKDASLKTFITLCIERKVCNIIRRYNQTKYKTIKETYSIDYISDNFEASLMDFLSDNSENDPLKKITDTENYQNLINIIDKVLSKKEKEIYLLRLKGLTNKEIADILGITSKQVENTYYRVKLKIKGELDN